MKIKQIYNLQTELNGKINTIQLSTDTNLGLDDTLVSSQNAIKQYLTSLIGDLPTLLNYKGAFNVSISGTTFDDISPAYVGDFYKISGNSVIDGVVLNNGDMLFINVDTVTVTAADVTKIDNTETVDLIHKNTQLINDSTFDTATDLNLASGSATKILPINLIELVKEESYVELTEEFVCPINTANTNVDFYLMLNTATTFPIIANINGVLLSATEATNVGGTNVVTINVPYALDATDTLKVIYRVTTVMYNETQTIAFNTISDTAKIIEYTGGVGTTTNLVIDSITYVIGNVGGSFVFDIGGANEHTFNTIGETFSFTSNLKTFTIIWAGFGSLVVRLSRDHVVENSLVTLSQTNGVTSQYYTPAWATFNSTQVGYLHGFLKVGDYIFASTRSGPVKILKLNANDLTYEVLEFTGAANFETTYGEIDKLTYSATKDRIYGCFGDLSPYDRKVRVVEINPHTLAWSVVITETRNPNSGWGPPITCDANYLYVGTYKSGTGTTDDVFKYNLSDYSYVGQVNVSGANRGIHALYADPYSNYLYATEFSYTTTARVFKIDRTTLTIVDTVTLDHGSPTDEFAITQTHIFVGLEDPTLRYVYKIDKSNLANISHITLPSGVTPCYGLTYDGTWIWGTYATSPGKLLKLNPTDMTYTIFTLPAGYNAINGFIDDGDRMFLSCWDHPAKVARLIKSQF